MTNNKALAFWNWQNKKLEHDLVEQQIPNEIPASKITEPHVWGSFLQFWVLSWFVIRFFFLWLGDLKVGFFFKKIFFFLSLLDFGIFGVGFFGEVLMGVSLPEEPSQPSLPFHPGQTMNPNCVTWQNPLFPSKPYWKWAEKREKMEIKRHQLLFFFSCLHWKGTGGTKGWDLRWETPTVVSHLEMISAKLFQPFL